MNIIVDTRIILFGLWIAVMLTFLLGDVLRIYSGDYQAGMFGEKFGKFSGSMWFGVALLMVLPIIMIVLSLILPQSINRWANIIVAVFFILFNLVGLPTYPSAYDKLLIAVSLVFNGLTVWYAWRWV